MDYDEDILLESEKEENTDQGAETPTTHEDQAKGPRPNNITKPKFKFGYLKSMSLSCVIMYPFKREFFKNETFNSYFDTTRYWAIKHTGFLDGKSNTGILMQFKTVNDGDDAWDELRHEFSAMQDVHVEHPQFLQMSHEDNLWGLQQLKFKNWTANIGILKPDHVVEPFLDRILLLENVPKMTQVEMQQEFPEALNIVDFAYDPECPGFVGIELKDHMAAVEFLRKWRKNKNLRGNDLNVKFCEKKFDYYDHVLKKWLRSFPDMELNEMTDAERLKKVALFVKIRDERKEAEEGTTYQGYERLAKIHQINCQMHPLTRHLFTDACIRIERKRKIPEPEPQQTFMVASLLKNGKEARLKHQKDKKRRMHVAERKWLRENNISSPDDEPQRKRHFDGSRADRGRGGRGNMRGGRAHRSMFERTEHQALGGGYGGMGGIGYNDGGYGDAGMNMAGGYGDGGMSIAGSRAMGGMGYGDNSMTMTVAALTNKVRQLEQLATRQGAGGGGYGNHGGNFGGNKW